MYITSDHKTFSSKFAAYRHEVKLRRDLQKTISRYAEEEDKCIKKQHSTLWNLLDLGYLPIWKDYSIPYTPLVFVICAIASAEVIAKEGLIMWFLSTVSSFLFLWAVMFMMQIVIVFLIDGILYLVELISAFLYLSPLHPAQRRTVNDHRPRNKSKFQSEIDKILLGK